MKTTKCEMKNAMNGNNSILDIAKIKISELLTKRTIQNKTQRAKQYKIVKRIRVIYVRQLQLDLSMCNWSLQRLGDIRWKERGTEILFSRNDC